MCPGKKPNGATKKVPVRKANGLTGQSEPLLHEYWRSYAREDRARVVSVVPAPGAEGVEPLTEIRIQFDRPMDPMGATLQWVQDRGGLLDHGEIRQEPDGRTFVIPVRLLPACEHHVFVNSLKFGTPDGFVSVAGVAAGLYDWRFTTRELPEPPDAAKPRVLSVGPTSGAEVGVLTVLRVEFDQPMSPHHFEVASLDESRDLCRRPKVGPNVRYEATRRQFVLPIVLPPGWSNTIVLRGFRAETGAEAEPIMVKYSCSGELFSRQRLTYFRQARQNPQLRLVLEAMKQARQRLTSLRETVYETACAVGLLECNKSVFKMQGDRQFYGDVSQIMAGLFLVGSDGETCWQRLQDGLVVCPFDEIHHKNLLFCDPFGTLCADVPSVLAKANIEYLGTERLAGRRCHRIQRWSGEISGDWTRCWAHEWWIDGETWLPVQLVRHAAKRQRTVSRFIYDRVNEPMDISEFQPEDASAAPRRSLELLQEGYTARFLNVRDGSDGLMRVGWGMIGPGGRRMGGLN